MHDTACAWQRLAAGRDCTVDRCGHGTVHLTLGVLTLRLSAEHLLSITVTLQAAAQGLAGEVMHRRAHIC